MYFKTHRAKRFLFLLICVIFLGVGADRKPACAQTKTDHAKSGAVEFMTAVELKAKLVNEPVTIIDLRANSGYALSDDKIKGAIHIKLRKLRSRLSFPPLKDVPRDQQIVTYCACPGDETSVRGAQLLRDAGFKRVSVLKGGWKMWLKASGPVEARPKGL